MPIKLSRRVARVLDPVTEFLRAEAAGGFLLLLFAVAALVWANSGWSQAYFDLWDTTLTIGFGDLSITQDLQHWVNDGLMAIFFFVISLEIKRELIVGDLRDPRAAALPMLAAFGGVVVPVAIYLAITAGTDATGGWGIPMATDAAFAIAVLLLLGDRVSAGVKLFLVTIAVVDDVFAILVIALVYSGSISLPWLAAALGGLVLVAVMRRLRIASPLAYVLPALAIWVATYESGVHATIAGVALALLTPAGPIRGRPVLEELEHRLHPVSAYVVLPVFALANAGVAFSGELLETGGEVRVALAVALGLALGKLLGIGTMTWIAVRSGLGRLPTGMGARTVAGVAALGGIGFTVSLFITPLAFDAAGLVDSAKVGILAGSALSAVIGLAILSGLPRRSAAQDADRTR